MMSTRVGDQRGAVSSDRGLVVWEAGGCEEEDGRGAEESFQCQSPGRLGQEISS